MSKSDLLFTSLDGNNHLFPHIIDRSSNYEINLITRATEKSIREQCLQVLSSYLPENYSPLSWRDCFGKCGPLMFLNKAVLTW